MIVVFHLYKTRNNRSTSIKTSPCKNQPFWNNTSKHLFARIRWRHTIVTYKNWLCEFWNIDLLAWTVAVSLHFLHLYQLLSLQNINPKRRVILIPSRVHIPSSLYLILAKRQFEFLIQNGWLVQGEVLIELFISHFIQMKTQNHASFWLKYVVNILKDRSRYFMRIRARYLIFPDFNPQKYMNAE